MCKVHSLRSLPEMGLVFLRQSVNRVSLIPSCEDDPRRDEIEGTEGENLLRSVESTRHFQPRTKPPCELGKTGAFLQFEHEVNEQNVFRQACGAMPPGSDAKPGDEFLLLWRI